MKGKMTVPQAYITKEQALMSGFDQVSCAVWCFASEKQKSARFWSPHEHTKQNYVQLYAQMLDE